MRRAVLAFTCTAAGLVLLLGFKTHGSASLGTPPAALGTPANGSTGTAAGGATGTGSGSSGGTTTSAGTRTVTGDTVDTRFGPVQVRVTVTDGRISAVTAVRYPDGTPRDQEINYYAIPVLAQEAVAANGANIDVVSGATYTSEGYVRSLQSALDKVQG